MFADCRAFLRKEPLAGLDRRWIEANNDTSPLLYAAWFNIGVLFAQEGDNANAAIAYDAMLSGARGFAGVFTNVHPDLYKWLRTSGPQHPELAEEINTFLVIAAVSEVLGYPALAKMYHQRIGTFNSIRCRVITYDVREKFWALDAVLDKIVAGTEAMRGKIAQLPA